MELQRIILHLKLEFYKLKKKLLEKLDKILYLLDEKRRRYNQKE